MDIVEWSEVFPVEMHSKFGYRKGIVGRLPRPRSFSTINIVKNSQTVWLAPWRCRSVTMAGWSSVVEGKDMTVAVASNKTGDQEGFQSELLVA